MKLFACRCLSQVIGNRCGREILHSHDLGTGGQKDYVQQAERFKLKLKPFRETCGLFNRD